MGTTRDDPEGADQARGRKILERAQGARTRGTWEEPLEGSDEILERAQRAQEARTRGTRKEPLEGSDEVKGDRNGKPKGGARNKEEKGQGSTPSLSALLQSVFSEGKGKEKEGKGKEKGGDPGGDPGGK